MGTPPVDRQIDGWTDACQNITFPRTTYAGGNYNKIHRKIQPAYIVFCKRHNVLYSTPLVCPPGTFLNSDKTCEDCPTGQWNELFKQTTCKNCTGRKTNKDIGVDECGKYIFHFYLSNHAMVFPGEKYFYVDSRCMI